MGRRAGTGRRRGGRLTTTDPTDELVAEAADELYGLSPEEFTAARDERVQAARSGVDRSLATALSGAQADRQRRVLKLLSGPEEVGGSSLEGRGARRAQAELSGTARGSWPITAAPVSASSFGAPDRTGGPGSRRTAMELEQDPARGAGRPGGGREVSRGQGKAMSRTVRGRGAGRAGAAGRSPAGVVRDEEEPGEERRPTDEGRREQERERLGTRLRRPSRRAARAEGRTGRDGPWASRAGRRGGGGPVEERSRRLAEAEDAGAGRRGSGTRGA